MAPPRPPRPWLLSALLALPGAATSSAPPAQPQQSLLSVTADDHGGVSVSVGGEQWLRSTAPAWVHRGLLHRGLALKSASREEGVSEGLGRYAAQVWEWSSASVCNGTALRTELRSYADLPHAAVFTQTFPCGVDSVRVAPGTHSLASGWPSLREERPGLSWATFNGFFAVDVDRGVGLGSCKTGIQGGSPVMLYNESTMRTLIVSQLTRVKTGEMQCSGSLTLGLKGTLTSVPENFAASWLLVAGEGLSRSMEQWGDVLLLAGGKKRTQMYQDEVVSSLGYWTDNGAYYHYPVTGPTLQAGGYQTEVARVHNANVADRLPFRHWQLDSWWYQKGHGGNGSSRGSGPIGPLIGVYRWTADPFVFPDGLPVAQQTVGMPFVLHNRWFSPDNWYKRQGIPASGWTEASGLGLLGVLPLDGEHFWNYFFQQQKGYGLKVYEQDFLWTQYDIVPELRRNATMADDWLRTMADAARKHNLTIQYCMPYPRDYLASASHQAVTTIRASDDYKPNGPNWRIARQSLLAHALGVLPFKDTFLSADAKESGAANPGPELSAELHTLVSALSGSMVGPGDGPHMANRTRLMRACREDGILLKADRPAIPIDAAWTSRDPGGELSWSLTAVPGGRSQRYVLAAALERSYNLTVGDIELPREGLFIAMDWYSGTLRRLDAATPLVLTVPPQPLSAHSPVPFQYWTVSEAVDGWVLLGELSKYVTASAKRITWVKCVPYRSLSVGLAGAVGEQISLCALRYPKGGSPLSGVKACREAVVGPDSRATVVFDAEQTEPMPAHLVV